MILYKP